jgi:hypothetical protein
MAEVAGRVGDGINVPAGPRLGELVEIARQARAGAGAGAGAGRRTEDFIVTASGSPPSGAAARERLAKVGVDRLIVFVRAPYVEGIRQTKEAVDQK